MEYGGVKSGFWNREWFVLLLSWSYSAASVYKKFFCKRMKFSLSSVKPCAFCIHLFVGYPLAFLMLISV